MTTIPDKPEPPAEVWVNQRGVYGDVPLSDPTCPRYVLAPEGSAEVIVLDRQVAEQWMRSKSSYVANSELADAIDQALRAARGGAS